MFHQRTPGSTFTNTIFRIATAWKFGTRDFVDVLGGMFETESLTRVLYRGNSSTGGATAVFRARVLSGACSLAGWYARFSGTTAMGKSCRGVLVKMRASARAAPVR
jgi:hypothetical protein